MYKILCVGRFALLEGFDIAIKSFAQFYHEINARERKKVQLTLIGKGEEYQRIIDLCKQYQIEKATTVIDWSTCTNIKEIFESADLFLFTAQEGASTFIPQALSYSLPIISFNNFGAEHFVTSACSMTIPYRNYQESIENFAMILETLHFDPAGRRILTRGALKQYEKLYVKRRMRA